MNFIATVDENYLPRIHEIAGKLQQLGSNIVNVGRYTGVITGSTNATLQDLKIAGIKSVEPDRKIRL